MGHVKRKMGYLSVFLRNPKKITRSAPNPHRMMSPNPTIFVSPRVRWIMDGGVVGVFVGAGVRVGKGVIVGRGCVGVGVPGSSVGVCVDVGVGSVAVWISSSCPARSSVVD